MAFEDGVTSEIEMNHNLIVEDMMEYCFKEYEEHLALMIGRVIIGINQCVRQECGRVQESFTQQYILKKGMELIME